MPAREKDDNKFAPARKPQRWCRVPNLCSGFCQTSANVLHSKAWWNKAFCVVRASIYLAFRLFYVPAFLEYICQIKIRLFSWCSAFEFCSLNIYFGIRCLFEKRVVNGQRPVSGQYWHR
jgi:hypothetical protein